MATSYYTAPNFHVVFRTSTGAPAINGTAEFFKASDHGTRKAVYEDRAGTKPLPNPVILNSQGVIADNSGAAKPVFYADDENYYVEVKDSAGGNIQTVDDWNSNIAFFPLPAIEESNLTNYILNPQFRYFEKESLTNAELVSGSNVALAEEGWFFYRDTASSTNQIDFTEFAIGQTDVPHTPKYYLKFSCTIAGAETRKDLVLPFRDAISFSGQFMSSAIWARSGTGSSAVIQLVIRQYFGSGGSATVETIIPFTVTTAWSQLSQENFTIPSVAGKTIGSGDELQITIRMPLNQVSIIDLTNNQMNIGNILYDFNYTSSEEEDIRKKAYELPELTNSNYGYEVVGDGSNFVFRNTTGKIETYLLGDVPEFCLPMDGSTYERLAVIPGTDDKVTYDRLFQKWKNDSNILSGNAFGYGSDGFSSNRYSSTVIMTNINFGTTTAWAANDSGFTITTLQSPTAHGFDVEFNTEYSENQDGIRRANHVLWVINSLNGSVTDIAAGTSGFSLGVLEEGTAGTPEQSYILTIAGASLAGKYFTIDAVGKPYYIWFQVNGAGADPAIGGRVGLLVELSNADDEVRVAARIKDVLNGLRITKIVTTAATLLAGKSFFAESASTRFYVWFTVDGSGTDPAIGGKTGIKIELIVSDTADVVAIKIESAMTSYYFQVPDIRGYFLRAWNHGAGIDKNASERYGLDPDNIIYGDRVGTGERDTIIKHWHNVNAVSATANNSDPEESWLADTTDTDNIYGSPPDILMSGLMITQTGDQESRGINFSVLYAIRY